MNAGREPTRLQPTLRGPSEVVRRLFLRTILAIVLYRATVWSGEAEKHGEIGRLLGRCERELMKKRILGIVVFALCIWLKSDQSFHRWVDDLEIYQFYIGIYIILFGSCMIIFTSCLSCVFITNENTSGLRIMTVIYFVKYACGLIGAAILLNYSTNNSAIQPVIRESMLNLISQSQNDSKSHTLRLIQESIGCCGADGANDYLESRKPLPPECRDSVTGHTYFHGCVDELTWFLEEKASWLAGVAMFLCFFDVLKGVFTAILVKAIKEIDKGSY